MSTSLPTLLFSVTFILAILVSAWYLIAVFIYIPHDD